MSFRVEERVKFGVCFVPGGPEYSCLAHGYIDIKVCQAIAHRIKKDDKLFALVESRDPLESWVYDILKKWKKERKIALDKKLGVLLAQHPDRK